MVLFDIDGVIRDVENSYRLAVKKTVSQFCGWEPNNTEIDHLKSEGRWNNDWDASLELIKRYIQKEQLSIKPPDRENLINAFSKFYFGGDPYGDPKHWEGFIKDEPLLVSKSFFEKLTHQNIGWGFVSGAEIPSAKFVLEKRIGLIKPPLSAMGDAPEKPDPTGLIKLSSQLYSEPLGLGMPPISYLGDTVADVLTIQRARAECPKQKFISLAVAPPHLHNKKSLSDRKAYEQRLKDAGADTILQSTSEILQLPFSC